ncbi:MAG: hypothetical protein AB9846_17755 [Tenuifilaceae bacterium]
MKTKTVIILLLTFSFICHSCDPGDEFINPANYELYISISADKYPAVSPDGDLIAYYHECLENPEPEDYPTGLYLIGMDGTNRKLLLQGRHWSPSWSPDGQCLVFTSGGIIRVINLAGDSVRTFQGINNVPLFFPSWSPNGKLIVFSSPYVNDGGFFISDPLFVNARQLFDSFISGFSPKWSPSCEKIIYQKVSHDWEGGEIFIIDTLGTEDKRITYDSMDDREPTLSPNGNLIACSKNVRVHIMNSNGTNQHKIDYGQSPSWSLDSKFIIYSNANSDFTKEVLWKIDIDGKNKVQLTY